MPEPTTFILGGDLTIRRLGFGAMRITGPGVWGEPADGQEALAVLRRAYDLGVNFIDTADSYGPAVSERLIAEALYPYPADLVIATKGGTVRGGPGDWRRDGRPEHLREAVEASLRRLRREHLDLYQLHGVDPQVPIEESVGALADMQTEGKIRHVGVCNVDGDLLERARRVATVVSVQNRYNLTDRASDFLIDRCVEHGLAFIPWFPLASGMLTAQEGPLAEVARRVGATPAQVALAWLLLRAPVVVPIPGTARVAHLEENMGAAGVELGPEEFAALAEMARD